MGVDHLPRIPEITVQQRRREPDSSIDLSNSDGAEEMAARSFLGLVMSRWLWTSAVATVEER